MEEVTIRELAERSRRHRHHSRSRATRRRRYGGLEDMRGGDPIPQDHRGSARREMWLDEIISRVVTRGAATRVQPHHACARAGT